MSPRETEAEEQLDALFLATEFGANHPAMLDWAIIKFALRRLRKLEEQQP